MIRFEQVSFGYRPRQTVIEDFTLTVPDGGRIWLSGPSGRGKTTALRLLMGLEKPRQGRITGTEGLSVSAVFQEDRLLPARTVLQNAALFSDEAAARSVLTELGLGDVLDSLPDALSGGQRRRAALGRALAHPFDLLVLDEALTGLDEAAAAQCLAAIDRRAAGRMLVMAGHDAVHAAYLGVRTVAL